MLGNRKATSNLWSMSYTSKSGTRWAITGQEAGEFEAVSRWAVTEKYRNRIIREAVEGADGTGHLGLTGIKQSAAHLLSLSVYYGLVDTWCFLEGRFQTPVDCKMSSNVQTSCSAQRSAKVLYRWLSKMFLDNLYGNWRLRGFSTADFHSRNAHTPSFQSLFTTPPESILSFSSFPCTRRRTAHMGHIHVALRLSIHRFRFLTSYHLAWSPWITQHHATWHSILSKLLCVKCNEFAQRTTISQMV